jgi:2-desacetyl-2-hydroxyethyl bacteriochlorophyllide A dehydrogenase
MQALWLEEQKLEFRRDLPIPVPSSDQALIRMRLAGVCSTDLELLGGYYPYTGIPGHEFVGEVVNSPADHAWEGRRVVGEINIACGKCALCLAGFPRHCEQRKTLGIHDWNGAHAEYLVLPTANLHLVPVSLPDEMAVFTEPLAAAYEILEQVKFHPQDRVLVIGAGRLGQLVAQVLKTTGCELEVVARHPRQQQLLADHNIRVIPEDVPARSNRDIVVEATGSPAGFLLARKSVRPRGTIILKSTYKGDVQVNMSQIVVDEINLVGSRCGPFEPALRLMEEGLVDPQPLIEAIYHIDEGISAFEQAGKPGVLKVLIRPG